MGQVMACIDGSQSTTAVCDYAAWASREHRLEELAMAAYGNAASPATARVNPSG